jgi:hypothetical protein
LFQATTFLRFSSSHYSIALLITNFEGNRAGPIKRGPEAARPRSPTETSRDVQPLLMLIASDAEIHWDQLIPRILAFLAEIPSLGAFVPVRSVLKY